MTNELMKNGNMIIAESSEFVRLPNTLNEKQLQLLLLLVAQVKPTDEHYNWISVQYDDLIEMYNKNVYDKKSIESMKNMIFDLSKKQWCVQTDTKKYFGHYIDAGMFDDENRTINLKLSNETVYFFLQLDGGKLYTKYAYIKKLHTKCAIQLYRWCYLNSNFGNAIPIKIENAIKLFYDAENIIPTRHFIQKHLEPAISKINDLTDLHIEYEKVYSKKDKRKISSLKFTIKKYEDCMIEDFEDCEIDYDFFDDL